MPDAVSTERPVGESVQPKIEFPKSKLQRFLAYRRLWLLAAIVLAADQVSKGWIARHIPFGATSSSGDAIVMIPHFFYITHVGNPGAAWSMFTGYGTVLGILAAATLIAVFIWRQALGLHNQVVQICFGLLCGGIAGNLIDRMRYGYVIDFIDLHFGSYVYPTFNVADSGICIGVLLYLGHSLRTQK